MMNLRTKLLWLREQLRELERQPLKHSVLQVRWFSQDDANQKVKPPKLSYEMLG